MVVTVKHLRQWFFTSALVVIAAGMLMAARPAEAADGMGRTLGLGLEFGHGAGFSVKYAPSPDHALQFGIYSYNYGRYRTVHNGKFYYGYDYGYDSGSFLIHADYLKSQSTLVRGRGFSLPWYAGGGVDLGVGGGAALGIHGNLGVALQFTGFPLDIFVEWTPRLWVIDFVQLHPVDFNSGIRFWF